MHLSRPRSVLEPEGTGRGERTDQCIDVERMGGDRISDSWHPIAHTSRFDFKCGVCPRAARFLEGSEQKADLDSLLIGMAEHRGSADLVVVAATDSLVGEVARLFQVGHDALCRAFGDTGHHRYVAGSNVGVLRDQDQDSGVAGEEGPRSVFGICHGRVLVSSRHACHSTDYSHRRDIYDVIYLTQ